MASPADFAGADDITTKLAKERETGIEIIERTPQSLIITSLKISYVLCAAENYCIQSCRNEPITNSAVFSLCI